MSTNISGTLLRNVFDLCLSYILLFFPSHFQVPGAHLGNGMNPLSGLAPGVNSEFILTNKQYGQHVCSHCTSEIMIKVLEYSYKMNHK